MRTESKKTSKVCELLLRYFHIISWIVKRFFDIFFFHFVLQSSWPKLAKWLNITSSAEKFRSDYDAATTGETRFSSIVVDLRFVFTFRVET